MNIKNYRSSPLIKENDAPVVVVVSVDSGDSRRRQYDSGDMQSKCSIISGAIASAKNVCVGKWWS